MSHGRSSVRVTANKKQPSHAFCGLFSRPKKGSQNTSDERKNGKSKISSEQPQDALLPAKETNHTTGSSTSYLIPAHNMLVTGIAGQGSYGVVYKAEWNNKIIAVKQTVICFDFKYEHCLNERDIMQLLTERNAPHTVRYYGYNCDTLSSMFSIAMQYVPGGTLNAYIESHQRNPLNWKCRYKLLKETIEALAFLHQNGIIHRDIKSANFLLDDKLHPYLCDFGLSVIANKNRDTSTTGTPDYMAPEIWMHGEQKPAMDIYSWSIMMWEVGSWTTPPFNGFNAFGIYAHVTHNLRLPIPDDCNEKFKLLIRWGWRQDPDLRPSAEEIKNEFDSPLKEISVKLRNPR